MAVTYSNSFNPQTPAQEIKIFPDSLEDFEKSKMKKKNAFLLLEVLKHDIQREKMN